MRLLFITRTFPPSIGGLESASYQLHTTLSGITEVRLLQWGGSKIWLPLVLPYFFLRAFVERPRTDMVYLQDGLLAPLGLAIKVLLRKPVVITINGLDITYKNPLYQSIVPWCTRRLDRVICISRAAKEESVKRLIPNDKTSVISYGVSDRFWMNEAPNSVRDRLSRIVGMNLSEQKVLLSVGRLVERKGIHWFVDEVVPKLLEVEKRFVYLIAGDGGMRSRIKKAIHQRALVNDVVLLGEVDEESLKILYNGADVLVVPNIPVVGDMEGLGLVALEAATCGLVVVASKLEGLVDAIEHGRNGFLVNPYDRDGFVDTITEVTRNRSRGPSSRVRTREFTLENYSWDKIGRRYMEEFSAARGEAR